MWPFKRKKKAKQEPATTQAQAVRTNADLISKKGWVTIKEIDFWGRPCSLSPNKEFFVAWRDSGGKEGITGYREQGHGSYVLVKDGQILVNKSDLERPNDGRVANNGTFLINDWLFGDGKKGVFYVTNKAGEQIIAHQFSANIYYSWIADEGEFAACMCSDTLTLFDLSTGKIVKQFVPECGRAEDVRFDVAGRVIHIKTRNGNTYKYTFDGHFIDQEKYRQDTIEDYSSFDFLADAEEMFKDLNNGVSGVKAKEVEQYVYKALKKKDFERYPNYKAKCYRILGEIKEGTGDVRGAVADYETALSLDEKVGVKRRLGALKKEI